MHDGGPQSTEAWPRFQSDGQTERVQGKTGQTKSTAARYAYGLWTELLNGISNFVLLKKLDQTVTVKMDACTSLVRVGFKTLQKLPNLLVV